MTGELAGAAFAVKDAVSEVIVVPKMQSVFSAIQKYGEDSYEAAEAYLRLAQERFAEGDKESANRFLAEADGWAAKVRAALEEVEQLERIKTATVQDWAAVNAATFDILRGNPERARAFLAALQDAQAQWSKTIEAEGEAARVAETAAEAALAAADAEVNTLLAPLDKLSERLRAERQHLAEAQARKDAELLFSMRQGVLAGLANMDEEAKAAAARLTARIDQISFAQLSAGEQLKAQTQQLETQLESFYKAGVLGVGEFERAAEALSQQLERANELLNEEQSARAFEAMSQKARGLARGL